MLTSSATRSTIAIMANSLLEDGSESAHFFAPCTEGRGMEIFIVGIFFATPVELRITTGQIHVLHTFHVCEVSEIVITSICWTMDRLTINGTRGVRLVAGAGSYVFLAGEAISCFGSDMYSGKRVTTVTARGTRCPWSRTRQSSQEAN